jgi:hypothetical protein
MERLERNFFTVWVYKERANDRFHSAKSIAIARGTRETTATTRTTEKILGPELAGDHSHKDEACAGRQNGPKDAHCGFLIT